MNKNWVWFVETRTRVFEKVAGLTELLVKLRLKSTDELKNSKEEDKSK